MKIKSVFLFLFLICGIKSYAYDLYPLDFEIDFPEKITIKKSYPPSIRKQENGSNIYYTLPLKLLFQDNEIDVLIRCLIDHEQVPYSENNKELISAYFSNERGYDLYKILPESRKLFSKDNSYSWPFKANFTAKDTEYIPGYESDLLFGQDGTKIERDFTFGRWAQFGVSDSLTYYIKDTKSIYSEYIIEFQEVWFLSWLYRDEDMLIPPKVEDFDNGKIDPINKLYTLTNEELVNYPDQYNPSIQLMHLINQAMTTFRFKDRPNIPDQNIGVVKDNQVRIRNNYSLDSEILGHVNSGEEVIVMERSPAKLKIGDTEDYWYKIVSKDTYVKGWMYGAFLDLR